MRRIDPSSSSRCRQRGVTLIEALIAMLVMSLGLLAFAGLHARLRLNSDLARQRAEATRLAQEDMENLRAFSTLTAYGNIATASATKAVLASDIQTTANASYTIARTLDTTDPRMKQLVVSYAWTDRSGTQQAVTLRSTIAGVDPKLAAALLLPASASPTKEPLGRNVQIPIPAKKLGDGTSVFKPLSGGTVAYVLSDTTGHVTKKCTGIAPTTMTAQITASTLSSGGVTCTSLDALIVSGFVRFALGGNVNVNTPTNDPPPGALSIALNLDQTTIPTGYVGWANQLGSSYWSTPPASTNYVTASDDCRAEDSTTVSYTKAVNFSQVNEGQTQTITSVVEFAIVPWSTPLTAAAIAPYTGISEAEISNVAATGERYVAYSCVVRPINLGGSTLSWSGRTTVVTDGTWTIGTQWHNTDPTKQTYKICRYSADLDGDGQIYTLGAGSDSDKVLKIDNQEHPNAYLNVSNGLSNQDFLVVRGNNACPVDSTYDRSQIGSSSSYNNFIDQTSVQHQP